MRRGNGMIEHKVTMQFMHYHFCISFNNPMMATHYGKQVILLIDEYDVPGTDVGRRPQWMRGCGSRVVLI